MKKINDFEWALPVLPILMIIVMKMIKNQTKNKYYGFSVKTYPFWALILGNKKTNHLLAKKQFVPTFILD